MRDIRLSYVLTTRNKLEYLRVIMERLLDEIDPEDEVVVVDGASTDGTVEYLESLRQKGALPSFVSAPDRCQAHGANRALLAARGELIKVLTDDDAVHFPGIRRCRNYLLDHPEVALLNGNTADLNLTDPSTVWPRDSLQTTFQSWMDGKTSHAWFGDQSVFYRRSFLPLIGLWHTGVACIDVEQSIRITTLRQIPIVWYTGYLACAIYNPSSTSLSAGHQDRNARDVQRIVDFYSPPSVWNHGYRSFRQTLRTIERTIRPKNVYRRLTRRRPRPVPEPVPEPVPFRTGHEAADRWLEAKAAEGGTFLGPHPQP